MAKEVTKIRPKRIATVIGLAVTLALSIFRYTNDVPVTFEFQVCGLLSIIACLLWDIFDAVMFDKMLVIKNFTVNVKEGEKE